MRAACIAHLLCVAATFLGACSSSEADNGAMGGGGASPGPLPHDASSTYADVVSSTQTGGSGGETSGSGGSSVANDAAVVEASEPPLDASSQLITANPNASNDAHKILAYLTSLKGKPGKHVISGQNIGGDGIGQFAPNLVHYVEELHTQTGKWIALAGFGLGYPDLQSAVDMQTTRKYAADWWKTGGLVTMWASPGNPQTGGNAQDNNFSGARQLITPGNPLNDKWKAILDRIATALGGLQDDGVVVLWRPLHEMNGNWFWWSMDNGVNMAATDFVAIWKYEFDYFTNVKHLNNLLWVYAPNAAGGGMKAVDFYFPGSSFVDLGGEDFYNPDPPSLGATNYDKGRLLTVPFGFTEFGPGQSTAGGADGSFDNKKLIDAINAQYRDITFFMYWSSWQGANVAIIDNKNANGLMNEPSVITRDDLAWK